MLEQPPGQELRLRRSAVLLRSRGWNIVVSIAILDVMG